MQEDNELMESVKNGDKIAYEILVIKYRVSAIRFANNYISDMYFAEDIVQEAFAIIYINRMTYKPSHSFKTFLFTIVRNKCIDYLRVNKAMKTVEIESVPEKLMSNNIFNKIDKKLDLNFIFKLINNLNDDYKTALYLFAVDEMSYAEIAKIMGKSTPQIKIIIYRARTKLKKYMKEGNINEK